MDRYWSRRFRQHMELKRSARMTGVPHLGVPEIFIDDEVDQQKLSRPTLSPLLSPLDITDHRSFQGFGVEGTSARSRRGTINSDQAPNSPLSPGAGRSPQLSPHRPTNSEYSFEQSQEPGSGEQSRRGSAVSAENVLQVLDESAWGESIRRSFTTRRPDRPS